MGFRPVGPAPSAKGGAVKFRPIGAVSQKAKSTFRPVSGMNFPVAAPVASAKVAQTQPESGGMWRKVGNQLIKPVSMAANLLEDTGKTIAAAGVSTFRPDVTNFQDAKKKLGVDFLGHQKDVLTGKNKRMYSDIMAEIAGKEMAKGSKVLPEIMTGLGVASDFILDPLNKVKILGLTQKGNKLARTGELALSAADQAKQGERALLQFGNTNILPSVGNKVLSATTKANDLIRANKYGAQAVDALANLSTKVRPAGVARDEWKVIGDATRTFKKSSEYATKKAIEQAAELEAMMAKSGADDATRQAVLHAVEKGDASLVPQGFEEVFQKASAVKEANEQVWKQAGGATIDNYGLPHVATDAVKEAQPTTNLRGGGKIYSPATGQDIQRQWVKADGKILNLEKSGIKFNKQTGKYYKMTSDKISPAGVIDLEAPPKGMKLDDVTNIREKTLANIVKAEADEMADMYKNAEGVTMLNTGSDYLPGAGEFRRVSDNPQWYKDFYKRNGRAPGKKEILEIAKDNLKAGRGFLQEFYDEALQIDNTPGIDDLNAVLGSGGKTVTKKEVLYNSGKQSARRPVSVNIEQATAKEINEALAKEGKDAIFKEDLPTALAVGGISSGRKAAGETFLKATKDKIKSDRGLQIIDETYQRLTNNEAVGKALKAYDKVLGVWKAQILVAPSYHVRNEVGNLWNNFLAGTSPLDYATAAKIQQGIATGKLDDVTRATVQEMEQQGVIGSGWYGKDITQNIADEIGGASWNPLSQRFGGYKANRAIGTTFEDNARIAHYLSKRREGFSVVEAAKSVEKFLFDYGDLTWIEQNVLKRVLPFYTWSSKNIPLQLAEFVKKPGKFATAAKVQKNVEERVSKPDERYLSEYVKNNSPMRIRTNEDGSTEYLLLGQWLPAAQAIQFLSQPQDEILRGISPMVTIPSDLWNNKSFFKDTIGGEAPIEKYPGEMGSFLGVDMRKKAVNVLRGIRVLNEIDKWNPGLIFGGKDTPSIIPGGSQNRGAKHSPDSTEMSRFLGLIMGKTSNYNPENSKTFYDKDTEDRMGEYTRALDQALRFQNPERAKEILLEMEQFQQERDGKQSKVLEQYNLMGDQYLDDRFAQKQAEFERDTTRKKMREMIREGIKSGKYDMVQEAMKMDPTYAKDAVKDAVKETSQENMSDENKKMLYEVEQMKTKNRLRPYYQ